MIVCVGVYVGCVYVCGVVLKMATLIYSPCNSAARLAEDLQGSAAKLKPSLNMEPVVP